MFANHSSMLWVSLFSSVIMSIAAFAGDSSTCQIDLDFNKVPFTTGPVALYQVATVDIDFSTSNQLTIQGYLAKKAFVTPPIVYAQFFFDSPNIIIDGKTYDCSTQREKCKNELERVETILHLSEKYNLNHKNQKFFTDKEYIQCAQDTIAQIESLFEAKRVSTTNSSQTPTVQRAD
jgi:hypothetical protein